MCKVFHTFPLLSRCNILYGVRACVSDAHGEPTVCTMFSNDFHTILMVSEIFRGPPQAISSVGYDFTKSIEKLLNNLGFVEQLSSLFNNFVVCWTTFVQQLVLCSTTWLLFNNSQFVEQVVQQLPKSCWTINKVVEQVVQQPFKGCWTTFSFVEQLSPFVQQLLSFVEQVVQQHLFNNFCSTTLYCVQQPFV